MILLKTLSQLPKFLKPGTDADAVNAFLHALNAAVLCFDRRYEDALVAANTALAMQPDNPIAHFYALIAAANTGRHSEALATLKNFMKYTYAEGADEVIEQAWAQDGITGAMRQAATIMATRYSMSRSIPADTAIFFAMAQEFDEALKWLERAYETRDPNMPYITLPVFDPLRSDPRFQDLLRRMNLPGG